MADSIKGGASKEGLQYLNGLMQWLGTHGFALDNVRTVLQTLGNPQDKVRSIHVAGTNGKGSVSTIIAAILGSTGARVGLNTSPHLSRVNERIIIDGYPVDDETLGTFSLRLKKASEWVGVELSFFEAITSLSFMIFADLGLDWMVIEVGLGGRLDATNVIANPVACVVVTIDYDHEDYLGDTLTSIAKEKASIIKPGSKVVTGSLRPEARVELLAASSKAGAVTHEFGRTFSCHFEPADTLKCRYNSGADDFNFTPRLSGEHQSHNFGVAIKACREIGVPVSCCIAGASHAFWPARLERFKYNKRDIILDCAHNPAGVQSLVDYIRSDIKGKVDLAFGVLKTKKWQTMVELLLPVVGTWYVLEPKSQMALPADELSRHLSSFGVSSITYGDNYIKCLSELCRGGHKSTLVIAGSVYLAGAIRPLLADEFPALWQSSSVAGEVCKGIAQDL